MILNFVRVLILILCSIALQPINSVFANSVECTDQDTGACYEDGVECHISDNDGTSTLGHCENCECTSS